MFRDSIENIGNTKDGQWDATDKNGHTQKDEKIAIKLNLSNNLTP